MFDRIHWLGHGTFAIFDTLRIYINPRRIAKPPQPADIVLVSNAQYAICSPADIEKLRDARTQIIASASVASEIPNVTVLRPYQSISIGRACIKAVPSDQEGSLGFVISLNYQDIYYAGNAKSVSEMSRIQADIVLLPIDSDNLSAEAVAEIVGQLRPRYIIPFQWGANANPIDLVTFARLVGDRAQVMLPNRQNA
ncbi:MAG: MBL fold metallo-hydrolase [Chloroflexota bacterium]|nr:MBL fold metallo-hydrolase [Chloroflexota bacterium]